MTTRKKRTASRKKTTNHRVMADHSVETRTNFDYRVTPHGGTNGPSDALATVSSLTDRFAASARVRARRAKKIEEARAKNAAELTDFLGERNHRRFSEFSQRQRDSMYGITDVRPGHIDETVLREAQKAAHEKARRMLRRAGVDTVQLGRLFEAHTKRIRHAAKLSAISAMPLDVVAIEDAPSFGQLSGSTDDWGFVKTAPFDDWFWWGHWHRWGGSVTDRHNVVVEENPFTYITGQFGHFSQYVNKSASDWDGLILDYETGVGFWYEAPQPGPRDVWVRIKAKVSSVDVWLDDEYGFSCAWSDYWSAIEVSVAQLQGTQGGTGWWHAEVDGEPDDKWSSKPLAGDGADFWIPLTIDFPPGAVFIWIIGVDNRACGLNDVSTDARMETKYQVEAVHIAE